eukprot:236750-Rhodomonas_salina.3
MPLFPPHGVRRRALRQPSARTLRRSPTPCPPACRIPASTRPPPPRVCGVKRARSQQREKHSFWLLRVRFLVWLSVGFPCVVASGCRSTRRVNAKGHR